MHKTYDESRSSTPAASFANEFRCTHSLFLTYTARHTWKHACTQNHVTNLNHMAHLPYLMVVCRSIDANSSCAPKLRKQCAMDVHDCMRTDPVAEAFENKRRKLCAMDTHDRNQALKPSGANYAQQIYTRLHANRSCGGGLRKHADLG